MSVKTLFKELNDSSETDISMTDKQISIISAAIEIFAQKGYSATTTSEIAKKANVAEGTIFHHYKTKKDLLLAIPEYLSNLPSTKALLRDINRNLENPCEKFEDFLKAVIQNRRNFAFTNVTLIKVLFQEIPFHPELRAKISQTVLFPITGKLIKTIDKYKEQGQIIDIPSTSIVNLLFSSILGYFFSRYVARIELNWDDIEETEYLIQYIMNGICNNQAITSNNILS